MKFRYIIPSIISKLCYFVLIFLACSCSSLNIPSSTNIPILKEKGEKQIDVYASTNSFHFSGSYALSQKYALMLNSNISYKNFSKYYDTFSNSEDPNLYSSIADNILLNIESDMGEFANKYIELAAGKYNIEHDNILTYEIFVGGGYGYAFHKDSSEIANQLLNFNADYFTLFIQPNFGTRINSALEFGTALRLCYSRYDYYYEFDNTNANRIEWRQIYLNNIHFQPTGMLRIGRNKLKLILRLGFNFSLGFESLEDLETTRGTNKDMGDYAKFNTTFWHGSIGFHYNF